MSTESSRTYFGWQQEKTPFMFGMSARRTAMLGGGILCAIWPLASSRAAAGIVTWPLAVVLVALAFLRLSGRTVDEWVVAFVSFSLLRARGQNKFLSGPFAPRAKAATGDETPRMDLPGILAPLTILEAKVDGDAPMAIVHHRIDRTYTAVARIRFPGLGLVDSSRRDQRVAGWGGLLSSLCTEGSPIIRVQALQRLVPESGAALHRWHADHLAEQAPPAAVEITKSLLATATLATSQREAYLAFTLDPSRAVSAIKGAGGGTSGAATVLVRHLRALTSAISSADLQVEGWLSPRDLAEVLRTVLRPALRTHAGGTPRQRHDRRRPGPGLEQRTRGLPAAGRTGGRGGAPHALRARRRPVGDVLGGRVAQEPCVLHRSRAASRGGGPSPYVLHAHGAAQPRAAEREVMRERTSRHVAVSMRHKTGQIVPEHERAALQRAEAQDAERAAGHGLVRYTGYCTVTVTDPADLEDACAALEADASNAHIEVERMYLAQDVGFAVSALPLGMGLPKKRW